MARRVSAANKSPRWVRAERSETTELATARRVSVANNSLQAHSKTVYGAYIPDGHTMVTVPEELIRVL